MTVADTFVVDGTKYAIRLDRAVMRDVGVVYYSRRRFGSTAIAEDITMIYKVDGEEVRRSTSTGAPRAGFWEEGFQVMMDPDTGMEDAAQAGDSFEIVMRYEPTGATASVAGTMPQGEIAFESDGVEVVATEPDTAESDNADGDAGGVEDGSESGSSSTLPLAAIVVGVLFVVGVLLL